MKKFFKNIPEMLKASLGKLRDNKWNILKYIVVILVGTIGIVLAINLLIRLAIIATTGFVMLLDNLIPVILVIACIAWGYHKLYLQHQERIEMKAMRKQKEEAPNLEKREQEAKMNYYHLKMSLFEILDSRLCNQLELFKPQTPDLLQALNPIQIEKETGIIYYNFTVQKESELPLSKGLERTKSILSSVIMNRVRLQGIEGITPPTGNDPRVVLYVHNIIDRGLDLQITLVLNTEEYQKYMGERGQLEEESLIEHI